MPYTPPRPMKTRHAKQEAPARRPAAVTLAIRSACLACAVAGVLAAVPATAGAQEAASTTAQPKHRYDIAPATLDQVLNRFAGAAGIELSVDSALTRGKSSPGLRGSYTLQQGFAELLRGQGLQVVRGDNGAYSLRPAAAAEGESVMPVLQVRASSEIDATTEGSGSYAAGSATIAGKTAQPLQQIPNSVSVLTRQRMDDQNMSSLQDALTYVTGVQATKYGDGTSYFKARGNYLDIEFDGVPIVSGLQYLQQFDLAMYDRVEVVRGPSGLMDGAGDPGGAVNLVRKRPLDSFQFGTETQIGSFGSARQMVDITGPLDSDRTLRGRAVLVGSDGLQSVDGVRSKEFMTYGALDYDLAPRTTLSLSAGYQVNPLSGFDYGAPGTFAATALPSSWSQNFSPSWNNSYTSLQEVNLNLLHRLDNDWKSQTTVFYRHELVNGSYAYSGPGVTQEGLASYGDQAQRNPYTWFGADSNVSGPIHLFGQAHTLTVGADYSRMWETALSGFVSLTGPFAGGTYNVFDADAVPDVDVPFTFGSKTRIEQYGLYAQGRIHLAEPLTLILGGRETHFEQETQNLLPVPSDWSVSSRLNDQFIPYAGLVYDIVPALSAYLSYSKIFSPQTATSYIGAGLAPRTGQQFEAGLKGSFVHGRLSATAAAFRVDDNHRAITDPDHPNASLAGGKAHDEGVEIEVNGQPLPHWNVYAGYTYLNVGYDDDTPNLTDGTDPRHLFKLWTSYELSQGLFSGLRVGGGMLAQSAITRGVEQGDYAIFNSQIGYRFNRHFDAMLSLNNLFDRKYYIRPPGSFYSVFGDTRNALLSINYQM